MAQDRDRQDKKSTTQGRPPLDAHERGTDNPENPRSISPAHWQGQPVPTSSDTQTSQPGFDRRGAGTARQFGRAGDYGQQKNQDEQRPQRGAIMPDSRVLDAARDVLEHSGINVINVELSVHAGEVTVQGTVDNRDDKLAVERLLANAPGVVSVRNQLDTAST